MEINYHIDNPEITDKPWMVLVNGLFASLESWSGLYQDLTPYFRILRYDSRGQGKSFKPKGPYTLKDHVEDLKSLLDEVGIEKAIFLGLSNGGRIALSLGETHPERVQAIVAGDTYAKLTELLKLKLESWRSAHLVGGPFHRFDIAAPWVWGESVAESHRELIEQYREKAGEIDEQALLGLLDGALEDEEIHLDQIEAPILLFVGEEDVLTPPFLHQKMAKKISLENPIVIPGGHASLIEHPDSFKKFILKPLLEMVPS